MPADITNMRDAIAELKAAKSCHDFESTLYNVQRFLKTLGLNSRSLVELEERAYYLKNEYSDKETLMNMDTARRRVIEYLQWLMPAQEKDDQLLTVLNNFYLFLESLLERSPHRAGSIQKEHLNQLRIQNEYDVQYLLYAYLKPLYPAARSEVNEDTGYSTVRTDIFLDPDHVIEVKCTRPNMRLKKLVEEIEADMVHYHAEHIYFFLYDKEKLVENSDLFKKTYENKLKEKHIHIIIHQPKCL